MCNCKPCRALSIATIHFGSEAPKLGDRARYITTKFGPLREELRQRRNKLDSLVDLSDADALGVILVRVDKVFELRRRGQRQSAIPSLADAADNVFTIVSQDLQAQQFS